MNRRGYAFFDLDFTILPCDTLLLFCNYVMKRNRWRILYLTVFLPVAVLAAFRLAGSGTLKRFFLGFLRGFSGAQVEAMSRDFVAADVMPRIYPELRKEIEAQKKAGRLLILNTASPGFYVRFIADALGFDECRATNILIEETMPLLPRLEGRNNKGPQKIRSMLSLLPEDFIREFETLNPGGGKNIRLPEAKIHPSSAYSDSPADFPMLRIAEQCTLIHPESKTLLVEGRNSGWTVLKPARPYASNAGKYTMYLRQILGLYV